MRTYAAAWLLFALQLCATDCQRRPSPARDLADRWQQAEKQWQRPELSAGYAAWTALSRSSSQGLEAQRRLALAEEHYRHALALIDSGQRGGWQELQRGKALAPMDPALFLPLARACRAQGNAVLAVQYYRSSLHELPEQPQAEQARKELYELERDLGDAYVVPPPNLTANASWLARVPPMAALLVGTALGLLLAVGLSLFAQRRRRGRSLAELAETYPELQPALAYLIGRLRHELLKHRIGAAADVAQSLAAGQSSAELRVFLHRRLYGGERLDAAWSGYLQSFRRALGPDFDLARVDRGFASAQRAIHQLQTLELPLLRGKAGAVRKLVSAHERLLAFDRSLAALVSRLQRTPLDSELLNQAVAAVRGEHLAGQVQLDEVEIVGPSEPVTVAVYRTDLMLILKNLLRNAILAVGRAEPPRQIAVDVILDLLPTGEELVRLRVHDTSPEQLTPEQIYRSSDAEAAGAQHGLGLVTAALSLYSGSIAVEAGRTGYAKCVTVQLFRAFDSVPTDASRGEA